MAEAEAEETTAGAAAGWEEETGRGTGEASENKAMFGDSIREVDPSGGDSIMES